MHSVCARMNVYSSVTVWGISINSTLIQPRQSYLSLFRHVKYYVQDGHKASQVVSDRP